MNKTLYISEADKPIWDDAERLLVTKKRSLSQVVTGLLSQENVRISEVIRQVKADICEECGLPDPYHLFNCSRDHNHPHPIAP